MGLPIKIGSSDFINLHVESGHDGIHDQKLRKALTPRVDSVEEEGKGEGKG